MLKFISQYWTQIIFLAGVLGTLATFIFITIEGVKCSLRNDILQIYDMCKKEEKITEYQLEALLMSAELYSKLRGNSFVKEIVEKIKKWEVIK